jgi:uncharacterized protein (DUF305 family)
MLAATVVAAAAVLAACSNGDSGSAADFNKADVAFAQEMIPHHRQATEMAEMAASRTDNADVLELAEQISTAQEPEIKTMTTWLKSWREDVPEDMGSMEGMDHSGMDSMPGMMSADEMSELEGAQDAAFDELFLTMMVEHHEGAIEMAKKEQTDGKNADAVELAKDIEIAQTAEISTMRELLGS